MTSWRASYHVWPWPLMKKIKTESNICTLILLILTFNLFIEEVDYLMCGGTRCHGNGYGAFPSLCCRWCIKTNLQRKVLIVMLNDIKHHFRGSVYLFSPIFGQFPQIIFYCKKSNQIKKQLMSIKEPVEGRRSFAFYNLWENVCSPLFQVSVVLITNWRFG